MDKRLVIDAYRKGMITKEQCAQILGIESEPLLALISTARGEVIDRPEPQEVSSKTAPDSLSKSSVTYNI
ncbi:MAG: hypothetical protein H7X86_05525 [Gorillibacterium sp.]|nr:hypothetical protein [Gorillibacterium sp.]